MKEEERENEMAGERKKDRVIWEREKDEEDNRDFPFTRETREREREREREGGGCSEKEWWRKEKMAGSHMGGPHLSLPSLFFFFRLIFPFFPFFRKRDFTCIDLLSKISK